MRPKYFLLIIMIIFMKGEHSYSQVFRHTRELIMFVRNGEPNSTVTFFTESEGSTVWDQDGLVTTDPLFVSPCDLAVNLDPDGNSYISDNGWDTTDPNQDEPHLGRGEYTISVDVGNATLSVDCYGTEQMFENDRQITYDVSSDSFYNEENKSITNINLFDNPAGLQPTPPQDFTCTNSKNIGEDPHFEWWWSDEPRPSGWPDNFKYKIYRSENLGSFICIASDLTFSQPPLEWTDHSVSIDPYGSRYIYYATAYFDQSPESDPSDHAFIRGYPEKALPEKPDDYFSDSDVTQIPTNPHLYAYPNPFNPTTIITYQLPSDGYVRITVYNITGQAITELVNKKHFTGKYHVIFNGQSLAGGIYLIRFQFNNQLLVSKILLFK